MSYVGWLDFNSAERKRVLDALELLRQEGTVDELGMGGVRDTLADILSPGTSTIQTRARYFFFLPWIYQTLRRRGIGHEEVEAEGRKAEIQLIEFLKQSPDFEGTIGISAGEKLRRLPSEIYWAGLKTLGVREFEGSLSQFHKAFDQLGRAKARKDDGGMVLEPDEEVRDWNPRLPKAPPGFPKGASLSLGTEEAAFLAGQLERQGAESLFRFLVVNGNPAQGATFPWEHPGWSSMPPELQHWLEHGRCFSELMHGAAILYNLFVARQCEEDRANGTSALDRSELLQAHDAKFQEWKSLIESRRALLTLWDYKSFFQQLKRRNPRLSVEAERFSSRWIQAVCDTSNLETLANAPSIKTLIADREFSMKRDLARMRNPEQRRTWGGASSINRLDYRWYITRVMARDIIEGLRVTPNA